MFCLSIPIRLEQERAEFLIRVGTYPEICTQSERAGTSMALLTVFLASSEIFRSANLEKSVSELISLADFRDSKSRTSSIFFNSVSPPQNAKFNIVTHLSRGSSSSTRQNRSQGQQPTTQQSIEFTPEHSSIAQYIVVKCHEIMICKVRLLLADF